MRKIFLITSLYSCLINFNLKAQETILDPDSLVIALNKLSNPNKEVLNNYLLKIDTLDLLNNQAKKNILTWIISVAQKNNEIDLWGKAQLKLANAYAEVIDYPEATKQYLFADSFAKKNNLPLIEAGANYGLAKIFVYVDTISNALKRINKAIDLAKNDNQLLSKCLSQKSFIIQYDYSIRGIDTGYDEIFNLKQQAIEISKSINDSALILANYIGLSETRADNNEFEKAIALLDEAKPFIVDGIKGQSKIGYYFVYGKTILLKGLAQKNNNDYKAAIPYLEKALEYAQLYKNLDWKSNSARWLSSAYFYAKDYKNAFDYLKKGTKYADSVKSLENSIEVKTLQRKYDFQLKENELISLQNENNKKSILNKILIGTALALSLIVFLGYRNFRTKQKLQQQKISELEKEKQLAAIDNLLQGQEEERSRLAKDLHDGLGGMLSGVKLSFNNMKENLVLTPENFQAFQQSINRLDETITELRKVSHNLMPDVLLKFGLTEALQDYCSQLNSSTNATTIVFQHIGEKRIISNTGNLYMYRIIQELINNSLKHGNATSILAQLNTNAEKILITVDDNGKGFNPADLINSKGIGMSNIKQRVEYLKGKMDIDSQLGKGTSVNIELNI